MLQPYMPMSEHSSRRTSLQMQKSAYVHPMKRHASSMRRSRSMGRGFPFPLQRDPRVRISSLEVQSLEVQSQTTALKGYQFGQ